MRPRGNPGIGTYGGLKPFLIAKYGSDAYTRLTALIQEHKRRKYGLYRDIMDEFGIKSATTAKTWVSLYENMQTEPTKQDLRDYESKEDV